MDRTTREWTINEGTDVVGSGGDKVGEVVAVQDDYIVVEKGFFFPSDYYIPISAIAHFDGKTVYLSVTKDEALEQGWDSDPTVTAGVSTYADRTADTTATRSTGTTAGTFDQDAGYETRAAGEGETIDVPVREEELTATRRPVERGAVRLEKDVVEEEQTIDVPVTEERVTVQRRTVDQDVSAADADFEEGAIEVPVHGEEVVPQKRARVREDVEISKEPVERTERVSDTVRREEVRVDDQVAGGVVETDRDQR